MQITSFKLLVLTRNEIGGDPGMRRSVLEKRAVGTKDSTVTFGICKEPPFVR